MVQRNLIGSAGVNLPTHIQFLRGVVCLKPCICLMPYAYMHMPFVRLQLAGGKTHETTLLSMLRDQTLLEIPDCEAWVCESV